MDKPLLKTNTKLSLRISPFKDKLDLLNNAEESEKKQAKQFSCLAVQLKRAKKLADSFPLDGIPQVSNQKEGLLQLKPGLDAESVFTGRLALAQRISMAEKVEADIYNKSITRDDFKRELKLVTDLGQKEDPMAAKPLSKKMALGAAIATILGKLFSTGIQELSAPGTICAVIGACIGIAIPFLNALWRKKQQSAFLGKMEAQVEGPAYSQALFLMSKPSEKTPWGQPYAEAARDLSAGLEEFSCKLKNFYRSEIESKLQPALARLDEPARIAAKQSLLGIMARQYGSALTGLFDKIASEILNVSEEHDPTPPCKRRPEDSF